GVAVLVAKLAALADRAQEERPARDLADVAQPLDAALARRVDEERLRVEGLASARRLAPAGESLEDALERATLRGVHRADALPDQGRAPRGIDEAHPVKVAARLVRRGIEVLRRKQEPGIDLEVLPVLEAAVPLDGLEVAAVVTPEVIVERLLIPRCGAEPGVLVDLLGHAAEQGPLVQVAELGQVRVDAWKLGGDVRRRREGIALSYRHDPSSFQSPQGVDPP